mgnify:CR=1 FL=1
MAVKTHSNLRNNNSDFNNIIDSIRTTPVLAKTADYVITEDDARSCTMFTNRGASGTVAFTLPAPSAGLAGVRLLLVSVVAQVISVETATADTLITMGDVAADKLAAPGSIGAEIECWCDGTSWIALGRGETAGNTASLNYTVTT